MDYIEAFKNLRTNNKYGRKSPNKAILMLTVIELFEENVLSDNEIYYDDTLKAKFLKVWNRVLPNEPLFHPDAYLPFWYLQSDSFWHIVPVRGKEDILSLMRDTNIKPSEAKINECVKYAELDDDLYFLMTLSSGRSSLKRVLLETYTNLSEKQIDKMAESIDNTIDYSASALSDYEKILSNEKDTKNMVPVETDYELVRQFQGFSEDIQIVLNLQYYAFLKSHRNEREIFKEVCPTVYDLLDKIIKHPVKQGDILPSFAFMYENFLSDLKISLMSEEGTIDIIEKIEEAIEVLRGNDRIKGPINPIKDVIDSQKSADNMVSIEQKKTPVNYTLSDNDADDLEIEHVYLDSRGKIIKTIPAAPVATTESNIPQESRRGKAWTVEDEDLITKLFQQGEDFISIAERLGRTEVAVKARLAKLGLIEYTYGQEEQTHIADKTDNKSAKENDFSIENALTRCYILNKSGERVFSTNGKLKYLRGHLYRLNLKRECFTVKNMVYDGSIWMTGTKKIVAYPLYALYGVINESADYSKDVEDIVDDPVFEKCRLKVNGVWYSYNGNLISNTPSNNVVSDNSPKIHRETSAIKQNPLYAVRKQAILRAMSFFRLPAGIREIARTISRTAWRTNIKEEEVEDIISTMSEITSVGGKYILRKKL